VIANSGEFQAFAFPHSGKIPNVETIISDGYSGKSPSSGTGDQIFFLNPLFNFIDASTVHLCSDYPDVKLSYIYGQGLLNSLIFAL
jgi:hypothetical protein